MAHTLLFSGYGAPGCDDLAVCRLTADGTLETLSTLRHGRAPSFCCRGQNGWIYAASERGDGADVTAYVLDGTTLREIARIEIPTGRGLCHLYACGDVIYGSCFENGLYFAVDSALTRILWQFQPAGANAHWVQSVGHALFLADLGNSRLYRLALENNLPTGSVKTLPQPTGSGPRQVLDAGDGMLDCVYELDGHMRVLNHDGCTVSTVQASTVPK
ncbi:MAG: beta-propeller fold lactonase family protein, partial [Gemmiger qucibialis]